MPNRVEEPTALRPSGFLCLYRCSCDDVDFAVFPFVSDAVPDAADAVDNVHLPILPINRNVAIPGEVAWEFTGVGADDHDLRYKQKCPRLRGKCTNT